MNDSLLSMDETEDVISLISQTVKLCDKAGLKLKKFVSNNDKVLDALTPDRTQKSDSNSILLYGSRS